MYTEEELAFTLAPTIISEVLDGTLVASSLPGTLTEWSDEKRREKKKEENGKSARHAR